MAIITNKHPRRITLIFNPILRASLLTILLAAVADISAQPMFRKTYNSLSMCKGIAAAPDKGFYVGANVMESNRTNMTIMRTDVKGTVLWSRSYGYSLSSEVTNKVLSTQDGGVLLIGETGGTPSYIVAVKTSSTGVLQWQQNYEVLSNANSAQSIEDAVELNDGSFVMVGRAGTFGVLMRISSTGSVIWGNHIANNVLNKVCLTDNGDLLATGGTSGFLAIRFSSTGSVTWARTFSNMGTTGKNVTQLADGNFVFLAVDNTDIKMIKIDNSANIYFAKQFSTLQGNTILKYGLAELSNGNIIFTAPAGLFRTDNLGNNLLRSSWTGSGENNNTLLRTADRGYIFTCEKSIIKMDSLANICAMTNGAPSVTGITPVVSVFTPVFNTYAQTVTNASAPFYPLSIAISTVNCGGKCGTTDNVSVTFAVADSLCMAATLTLASISSTAVNNYTWTLNNTPIGNINSLNFQMNNPGAYVIKLIGSNGTCRDTTSKTVHVRSNCGAGSAPRPKYVRDYTNFQKATDVRQTFDKGFVIAGTTTLNGSEDMCILKTDSLGVPQWGRYYGNGTLSEQADLVRQTPDGGYLLVGNDNYIFAVKVNSVGTQLWQNNYQVLSNSNGAGASTVRDMIITSDSGAVIGGYAGGNFGVLLKLDKNGNVMWTVNQFEAKIYSICEDGSGNFIVSGTIENNSNIDRFMIAKVSSTGTLLWTKYYNNSSTQWATRIIRTRDGNFVFAGINFNSFVFQMVKVDVNGNIIWQKSTNIGSGQLQDGVSLVEDKDGGLYVGLLFTTLNIVMKYDANGNYLNGADWQNTNAPGTPVSNIIKLNDGGYSQVEGSQWRKFYVTNNTFELCGTYGLAMYTTPALSISAVVSATPSQNNYAATNNQFYIASSSTHSSAITCSLVSCNVDAQFMAPASACVNEPVTFTNTSLGAGTSTWRENGIPISTTTDLTKSFSSPGNYIIQLTQVTTCNDVFTKTITINAAPTISTVADATLTCGSSSTLSASGGVTYSWSPSTGLNISNSFTVIASPSVTTIYSVTAFNLSGCGHTDQVQVTVLSSPSVIITGTGSICAGESATLLAQGAESYTWMPGNHTTSLITVNPLSTTVYTVTGSGGLCTYVTTHSLAVKSLPVINVTGPPALCIGQSATVTASGAQTYTWSNGINTNSIISSPSTNTVYSVVGTDTNSCNGSSAFSITVNPLPVVSIAGSTTSCAGALMSFTAGGATNYSWSTGSNNSSISVSAVSNTMFSVTGTDVNACSLTTTFNVVVNPLPLVSISGGTSICSGQTLALTAAGATGYVWNNAATANTIAVSPSINTQYSITGTDANNCSAVAYHTVNVNALPTVSISGNVFLCSAQTATLFATGAVNYLWFNGLTSSGIIYSPPSTTLVSVTGTASNGCEATATRILTVNPLPALNVSGTTTVCLGTGLSLTGSGASTYTWNGSIFSSVLSATPVSNTIYTLSGSNMAGCESTTLVSIVVNPLPVLGVNGQSVVCSGGSVNISATGATTYNWSNGGGGPAISVSPAFTTTFTVTGTNTNNCQSIAAFVVTVNPLPTVTITGNAFICAGSVATLVAGGTSSYSWNTTAATSSIMVTPLTNTTYIVEGTDGNGCKATASKIVTVNAIPVLSTAGNTNICAGSLATVVASGASTYSWSTGVLNPTLIFAPVSNTLVTLTGMSTAGCQAMTSVAVTVFTLPVLSVSGQTQVCAGGITTATVSGANSYLWSNNAVTNTISLTPSLNTTLSVTGTNITGCSSQASFVVQVNPLPVLSISGNTMVCAGQNSTLTASGAPSFSWNTTVQSPSIIVAPNTNTVYTVTGTDANGCVSMLSTNFTVNPLPVVSIGGATSVCSGNQVTLTASGAGTYSWSTQTLTQSIVITPQANSVYSVLGIDQNNCSASTSHSVLVFTTPTVVITGSTSVCAGSSIVLQASGTGSYLWSNGSIQAGIQVAPTTNTVYSVIGTSGQGCIGTALHNVSVLSLPFVTASGNNTIVCAGSPVIFNGSGAATYIWSGGVSNNTPFFPSNSAQYSVTGTDGNGCSAVATISIDVMPLPVVIVSGASETVCAGDHVALVVSGAVTYIWDNGAVSPTISVSPLQTTAYTVTSTASNGCKANSVVKVTVDACAGLVNDKISSVSVFPNPFKTSFMVQFAEHLPGCSAEVFNGTGQRVSREMIFGESINISLAEFANGLYFVRILQNGIMLDEVRVIKTE